MKNLFQVLKTLGYEVYENIYQGENENLSNPFILWNIERDLPVFEAFDEPVELERSFQIHLYTPISFDYNLIVKDIREKCCEYGYSYPVICNSIVDNIETNGSANYQKFLVRHTILTTSKTYNIKEK